MTSGNGGDRNNKETIDKDRITMMMIETI